MRVVQNTIRVVSEPQQPAGKRRIHMLFLIGFCLFSLVKRTPGVWVQLTVIFWAFKDYFKGKRKYFDLLVFKTLDSFRFFEFDFFLKRLKDLKGRTILDVSSPRLLYLFLLKKHAGLKLIFTNPDKKDHSFTLKFLNYLGYSANVGHHNLLVQDLPHRPESFEIITCMSVLEHIPGDGDRDAVQKMWLMLKPGGRLLISVPCAKEPFEEYINLNDYDLYNMDNEGFYFGQKFYSEELLEERIFATTGFPSCKKIYGEKIAGAFFRNRQWKFYPDYPLFKESFFVYRDYRFFSRISDLPGIGVIAMEFVKPK